jgi:vacuolar-type H+-ATPase subunit H
VGPAESATPPAKVDALVEAPSEDQQALPAATVEADQRTDPPPVPAELQPDALRLENEAEAERITGDARRQAQELLSEAERASDIARRQAQELTEEAELEAKRIIVAAGRERTRLMSDLEQRQQEQEAEDRRTRLDSLSTIQEAEKRAEALIDAAERQRESILREAEEEAERKAAAIAEDAKRRADVRLEEAELEAKQIVVTTGKERAKLLNELAQERSHLEETRTKLDALTAIEEAAQKAEELLVAAEKRRDELLEKSAEEAERNEAEITEAARRQSRELLERSELEARKIVDDARREGARLASELAEERSAFEERRTTLSGFLAHALEEADRARGERDPAARDLDEELLERTSAPDR